MDPAYAPPTPELSYPERGRREPAFAEPPRHEPPPLPPAPAAPRPGAPPAWGRELEDARMVAIQMAAAGVTRGSVRAHLIRGLGIANVEPILDELFGPGTGDHSTVPWDVGRR